MIQHIRQIALASVYAVLLVAMFFIALGGSAVFVYQGF